MSATMIEARVTKPKPPTQPEESVPKTTTKVRTTTVQKAKALAAIRGLDLYDILDEILTPAIEREYARRVKD